MNQVEFAEKFINETNLSVFLTGKAGTGKTTLLKKIIKTTLKKTAVTAPTGIAALNAGGVTLHSFFQLPFGVFLPSDEMPNFSGRINTRASMKKSFKMYKKK